MKHDAIYTRQHKWGEKQCMLIRLPIYSIKATNNLLIKGIFSSIADEAIFNKEPKKEQKRSMTLHNLETSKLNKSQMIAKSAETLAFSVLLEVRLTNNTISVTSLTINVLVLNALNLTRPPETAHNIWNCIVPLGCT